MEMPFRSWISVAIAVGVAALIAGPFPTAQAESLATVDHQMGASIRAHEGVGEDTAEGVEEFPGIAPAAVQTPGLDVSHWEGTIDWATVGLLGARFAYIKATEGTAYRDPSFSTNYLQAYSQGIIRGAYHYARPDNSGGAAQADYFATHGGGWSADGLTLPGALDIEWGSATQGGDCYGLSQSAMVAWIRAFSMEYRARTTRWPVIYTSTRWWTECTGNRGAFSSTNPLWVARRSSTVGVLPYNWSYQTIWQYAFSGTFPGDQDRFNGDYSRVRALALG
ncbi:MAG TPA: GH25 family lysozyme [Solirubrobacterales bacterium]|jgi:lysozyme|nr:GH25 family lysozyme [Solirubrobacterales bacterium]